MANLGSRNLLGLAQQLRNPIVSHQLPPGYRLPSEAELAAEYHVSRGTIRETIKILAAQRLVESMTWASDMLRRRRDPGSRGHRRHACPRHRVPADG